MDEGDLDRHCDSMGHPSGRPVAGDYQPFAAAVDAAVPVAVVVE